MAAAAESVAGYIEAVGSSGEVSARHRAAVALHQSWSVLVIFQPLNPRPNSTLHQLRTVKHRLHVLFAEAMTAAEDNQPPQAEEARAPAGWAPSPTALSLLTSTVPATTGRWAGPATSCCARRPRQGPQRFLSWLGLYRGACRRIHRIGPGCRARVLGDVGSSADPPPRS